MKALKSYVSGLVEKTTQSATTSQTASQEASQKLSAMSDDLKHLIKK